MNTKFKNYYFKACMIFLFIIFKGSYSYCQNACSFQVNAGADTAFCPGENYQLSGSTSAPAANIISINWQPATGLSDSSILNPNVVLTSTISYTLNVTALSELVYNGDFSAGDTGFTTGYVPGTGGISGTISNEGEYDINTNPHNSHIDFATFGDHTTGTGNMLIVNGSDNFNVPLWCQSIAVVPFSNYDFSAWLRTCNWQNPAIFQFTINGIAIAPNFYLTPDTTTWEHFQQTWNSDTSSTAEICIIDISTWSAGNDFAVDDISFTGACSQSDAVTITVYPPPAAPLISQNGDTLFSAQGYSSYQWYEDSLPIAGAVNYFYVTQQDGNYYLMITDSNGCSASSNVISISTGLNTWNKDTYGIEIYPNPSQGMILVRGKTGTTKTIVELYDIQGRLLYHVILNTLHSFSMPLDLTEFLPGMYILKVSDREYSAPYKLLLQ